MGLIAVKGTDLVETLPLFENDIVIAEPKVTQAEFNEEMDRLLRLPTLIMGEVGSEEEKEEKPRIAVAEEEQEA